MVYLFHMYAGVVSEGRLAGGKGGSKRPREGKEDQERRDRERGGDGRGGGGGGTEGRRGGDEDRWRRNAPGRDEPEPSRQV